MNTSRVRACSTASAIRAGTVSRRSPRQRCSRSPSGRSTQGLPGRRRSEVSAGDPVEVHPVDHGSAQVRVRGCSRKDRVCVVGDAAGVGVGQLRRRAHRSRCGRARSASSLGVVEVAGRAGGRRPSSAVHGLAHGAVEQGAPGELVDADRHVQRDGVLGAGGVRGAGGEVHAQPGLEQHLARRSSRPPRPAPGGPPTAWCRGSGRRRRRGCRCAPRSPATRAASGRRWPGTGGRARARARRPAGSAAASSDAVPGARRSRRPRTGRSPCGRRPARSAPGRPGWRRCGCSATAAAPTPSWARRTAGVRIAVDVSSWSTSSNESSPTRSAGSALCT